MRPPNPLDVRIQVPAGAQRSRSSAAAMSSTYRVSVKSAPELTRSSRSNSSAKATAEVTSDEYCSRPPQLLRQEAIERAIAGTPSGAHHFSQVLRRTFLDEESTRDDWEFGTDALCGMSSVGWRTTTLGAVQLATSDADHAISPVAPFGTAAAIRASRIPIATSKPLRIACGRGGQPGIYTSTGSTRSTPPTAA
jgi:hypothetical protein